MHIVELAQLRDGRFIDPRQAIQSFAFLNSMHTFRGGRWAVLTKKSRRKQADEADEHEVFHIVGVFNGEINMLANKVNFLQLYFFLSTMFVF